MRKSILSLAALAALGLAATPVLAADHGVREKAGMSADAHADKATKKAHQAERKANKDEEKSAKKHHDKKKKEMKERKDKASDEGKKKMKMKEADKKMESETN